jgi:hypothetical protein
MFTAVFVILLAIFLFVAVRFVVAQPQQKAVTILLLAGYAVRLAIQLLSREVQLFSAGITDWWTYQNNAATIARLWNYDGIHYVTGDELPALVRTTLPSNLFAVIFYLNGETTRFGGTALSAFVACLTCLNVYALAIDLGAVKSTALKMMAFILFMPTFLFYTSDMYKDGLVYFGVILVLGSSIRLARKFSLAQLGAGLGGLLCVWLTRYYLAYVLPIPLLIGCIGLRSRSWMRALVAILALVVAFGAVLAYTSVAGSAANDAAETFEHGTSREVIGSNAETGGSGVTFDDGGSPFASLPTKLLYTLFSPFPWQSGSMGLQLAKIEVLAWYFLAYRAARAVGSLWRERRIDLVIILSFIVPTTVVYAVSFANIGLNIRERIGIVIAAAILASVSWRVSTRETEPVEASEAVATAS